MLPFERPIDLEGATVRATFRDRSQVMDNWNKIHPLLSSMSRARERRSWKIDRMEPITLTIRVLESDEERTFDGWDFEIEHVEDLVEIVGAENVEIIEAEQEGE